VQRFLHEKKEGLKIKFGVEMRYEWRRM